MREMMNNDETMRNIVQNMLNNPDILRTMFAENTQFQQVIQVEVDFITVY